MEGAKYQECNINNVLIYYKNIIKNRYYKK